MAERSESKKAKRQKSEERKDIDKYQIINLQNLGNRQLFYVKTENISLIYISLRNH